jgi:hypothetical protein
LDSVLQVHHFTHFYAFPVWYFLLSGIPSFFLLFIFIHRLRAHHHPVMVFSSPFYFPTVILISILSILVVSAISSMITNYFFFSLLFFFFFFIFSAFYFVRLDSVCCGGVLDYSPYALPSSAGQPLPTPRTYIVSIYSSCISLYLILSLAVSRLRATVNT